MSNGLKRGLNYDGSNVWQDEYSHARVEKAPFAIPHKVPMPPPGINPAKLPDPVLETARYADFLLLSLSIGIADTLALVRPPSLRLAFGVQNLGAIANIYINFGATANPSNGIKVRAGEMLTFDTVVPQNDVHIYSDTAATAVILFYANK